MARYITGSQAVIDVMRAMGLTAPQSVADSQDPTAQQMWQLAKDAGQLITEEHDWQVLQKDMTIVTVGGQTIYPLPADFRKFVVDSQWNRTPRMPALGSLTEQEWQMLKARNLAGTTFALLFRINEDAVEIYESPATPQTLVLPYVSENWVRQVSVPAGTKNTLTLNDDIAMFPSQLFKAKLRLLWRVAKQFDTIYDQKEYVDLLAKATSRDVPARTLSLRQGGDYPYLGVLNVPDIRYGS